MKKELFFKVFLAFFERRFCMPVFFCHPLKLISHACQIRVQGLGFLQIFGSHCFFFKLIWHRTIYQCLQIGYSVIFVKVGRIAARLLSKLVWENYISMVNFQPFLVNLSFRLAQNLIFFFKMRLLLLEIEPNLGISNLNLHFTFSTRMCAVLIYGSFAFADLECIYMIYIRVVQLLDIKIQTKHLGFCKVLQFSLLSFRDALIYTKA